MAVISGSHPLFDLLQRAECGNHTLDRDIAVALGAETTRHKRIGWAMRQVPWQSRPSHHWESIPSYTSSIDAIVRLVETIRPGAVWHLLTDYGDLNRAKVGPRENPSASIYQAGVRDDLFVQADAATPAIALCIALLMAEARP